MTIKFKQKIMNNAINGKNTVHGKYTYKLCKYTGNIWRCPVGSEDRQWILDNGEIRTAWKLVDHI